MNNNFCKQFFELYFGYTDSTSDFLQYGTICVKYNAQMGKLLRKYIVAFQVARDDCMSLFIKAPPWANVYVSGLRVLQDSILAARSFVWCIIRYLRCIQCAFHDAVIADTSFSIGENSDGFSSITSQLVSLLLLLNSFLHTFVASLSLLTPLWRLGPNSSRRRC